MFIQTVALKDVKCYALHGFYPEEQLIGNHFLLDVEVSFIPSGDTEDLQQTINYEDINTIILSQMANTQKLLETVVKRIIDDVLKLQPNLLTVVVGIRKLNPTMLGQVGQSFVQLSYSSKN